LPDQIGSEYSQTNFRAFKGFIMEEAKLKGGPRVCPVKGKGIATT
jgi:hypothetical protein